VTVGATFAILLSMIGQLRAAEDRAKHSDEALVLANRLEPLVIDLETGEPGFLITAQNEFLQPWTAAQRDFAERAQALERLVADTAEQEARARRAGFRQAATEDGRWPGCCVRGHRTTLDHGIGCAGGHPELPDPPGSAASPTAQKAYAPGSGARLGRAG
jgi:hypothetical protein